MMPVSDRNMDDLLAQLKTEFEPQSNNQQSSNQQGSGSQSESTSSSPPKATSSESMSQMLKELAEELESENRQNQTRESIKNPSANKAEVRAVHQLREQLNTLIDQDYQMQARKREAKLTEIRRQELAKIAAEQRRQAELAEMRQREELRESRRQEALKDKAITWLKNLNPRSEEGKWFEEFAYSYEHKLDAAVDYLEAMYESGL